MTLVAIMGRDLPGHMAEVDAAPRAILAIGRTVCPACQMLDASLGVIGGARPDLAVFIVGMDTEEDWAIRETVLWPRDIRVSPAAVPAMVLLEHGHVVASRQGSAPAHELDAWVTERFGPPTTEVPIGIANAEQVVLDRTAARRAQHAIVKNR